MTKKPTEVVCVSNANMQKAVTLSSMIIKSNKLIEILLFSCQATNCTKDYVFNAGAVVKKVNALTLLKTTRNPMKSKPPNLVFIYGFLWIFHWWPTLFIDTCHCLAGGPHGYNRKGQYTSLQPISFSFNYCHLYQASSILNILAYSILAYSTNFIRVICRRRFRNSIITAILSHNRDGGYFCAVRSFG